MSSATSNSSRCVTPFATQAPPKTYEQLLDDFIDNASDTDDPDNAFGPDAGAGLELGGPQNDSADASNSSPDASEPTGDMHDLNTPEKQRMTRVSVDRAARRAQLQPYQLHEVDAFMNATPSTQLGLMFVDIQAMKNELNRVLVNQPRFTVDEALHKTIAAYSLGVLLSDKLRQYKRSSTDVVLTIVRSNNTNVPSNLDQDPYAMSTVKAAISDALTQARSRIKKLIGRSIDENQSIYQLASKVIEGSQCTVSIPLCARLAVLRQVFTDCGSGLSYWNKVDSCLAHCRARANLKGNSDGVRKILAKMLKRDRSTYGSADNTSIPDQVSNFQRVIDDSL